MNNKSNKKMVEQITYRKLVFENIIGKMEYEELFDIMKNYAYTNKNFDSDIIYDIEEYFYNHGEITESQDSALWNIATKYRMIPYTVIKKYANRNR